MKNKNLSDLWVISSAFFFIFMGAGAFQQFLIPVLSSRLNRSALECSWILATLYLSFVFWRIFCGWTIKLFGDYWCLVLSSFAYTLFVVLAIFSNSYPALIAAAAIWGWGAATMWITASSQILDTSLKTKYGTSSGIFYTGAQTGQALGVFLLGVFFVKFGSSGMLLSAILITIAGNLIMLKVPKHNVQRESPAITKIFGVLKSPKSKIIAFMLFASSFGFGTVLSSFSELIKGLYGIALIGIITQGFYITRLICGYFLGWLSDRIGRENILIFGFLLSTFGLGLATFIHTPWVLFFASAAFGLQVGTVPVIGMAMIGDSTVPERRPMVFGAVYMWQSLGVAVSILSGMYLRAHTKNFSVGFGMFTILFLACTVLAFNLKKLVSGFDPPPISASKNNTFDIKKGAK